MAHLHGLPGVVHCTGAGKDSGKGTQIHTPFDNRKEAFRNPISGIYLRSLKSGSQKDIWTPMFIAALFTRTKRWELPNQSTSRINEENVAFIELQLLGKALQFMERIKFIPLTILCMA